MILINPNNSLYFTLRGTEGTVKDFSNKCTYLNISMNSGNGMNSDVG
jgi:hypothetical protein